MHLGESERTGSPFMTTNWKGIMGSEINYNCCYGCNKPFAESTYVYLVKLTSAQKEEKKHVAPMLCLRCVNKTPSAFRCIGLYRFVGPVQK